VANAAKNAILIRLGKHEKEARRTVLGMKKETIQILCERERKSLREISAITKHDFSTGQKNAYNEDWRSPAEERRYDRKNIKYRGRTSRSLTAGREITQKRRASSGTQLERLWAEHKFKGSYGSVKRYLRRKREADEIVRNELIYD